MYMTRRGEATGNIYIIISMSNEEEAQYINRTAMVNSVLEAKKR